MNTATGSGLTGPWNTPSLKPIKYYSNELDHWVESNWENNPVVYKYQLGKNNNGSAIKCIGYRAMRKTKLKEMYIVRYADDFRILCRTKTEAELTKIAITQKLQERLKLEVS